MVIDAGKRAARKAMQVADVINGLRAQYDMARIPMSAARNRPSVLAAKQAVEDAAKLNDSDVWRETLAAYREAWESALRELMEERRESAEMVEVAHG